MVHRDDAVEGRLEDGAFAGFAGSQLLLGPPLFGHVPEDQHDADELARRVPDRGGAVVNRALRPVLGDQDRVVRQSDDDPFPQHLLHRVLHRLPGLFVDDGEHGLQRLPLRIIQTSTRSSPGPRRSGTSPARGRRWLSRHRRCWRA